MYPKSGVVTATPVSATPLSKPASMKIAQIPPAQSAWDDIDTDPFPQPRSSPQAVVSHDGEGGADGGSHNKTMIKIMSVSVPLARHTPFVNTLQHAHVVSNARMRT